jgi:long-chain acyl-CoA synthetase
LKRLELYPINFTVGVNTWYKKLMQHNRFKYLDHGKILVSIAGGEYVPVNTKNDWKSLTGRTLYSGYGLTETSSLAIISPLNLIENIDDSLGIAIHDTEVGLLGDNKEWILKDEVQGELLMRGPQLLKAYYNNEQETQDAFFEGWFKTGDIVKRVKGSYFKMVDRKKEMISVSGNKVYPNEVEEVFFQNKAVLDASVVGRASEKTGEEVVAFVVLKENIELNELDLLEYCRNQLTRFKVPKEIIFKKELPKTPIGKTAKSVLRESLNR